jgi:hypothetical protein
MIIEVNKKKEQVHEQVVSRKVKLVIMFSMLVLKVSSKKNAEICEGDSKV